MYADFRYRYAILAPKEAHKAMKMVKRPVTDEKKNIAATHAVMEKVDLSKEKYQFGHTKIFFRAGILGLMEEFRDDRVTDLVTMLQAWCRAYQARKVYYKLWAHKRGLFIIQRTIRNFMMGKRWLWWQLWLAIKPQLKAGNFAEYKKKLEEKAKYASEHLDDVIKEREQAEKKNGELTKEVDEVKISLAGGTDAKQDLIDKIARLEDQKTSLSKELQQVGNRQASEQETIDGLSQHVNKIESSQGSLGKDLEDAERRLTQVEDEKKDKEEQVNDFRLCFGLIARRNFFLSPWYLIIPNRAFFIACNLNS